MNQLILIDADRNETPAVAAARRLRGELAQLGISGSELARRLGMSQTAIQRRLAGETVFDLELLGRVCDDIGVSYIYVATGIREVPGPGDGGIRTLVMDEQQGNFGLVDRLIEASSIGPSASGDVAASGYVRIVGIMDPDLNSGLSAA